MGLYKKITALIYLLGFYFPFVYSVSITLINDSSYPLNAQIIDANGEHLALIHLVEGQMYIYNIPEGSFDQNPNQAYTPLTVIFLCESARPYDYNTEPPKKETQKQGEKANESEYVNQFGIWTNVPRGATVTALGSPTGTKSCIMKKNPKLKGLNKSSRLETSGANRWSNDGGSSWTNDSGSSKSSCQDDGCFQNTSRIVGDENLETTTSSKENEPPLKQEEKKVDHSSWSTDGGKTWTNDDSSATHTPTKSTPLPFKER